MSTKDIQTRDFLVEVGTEELPPKSLLVLATAFQGNMEKAFKAAGLAWESAMPYATPRRLALLVAGLQEKQADRRTTRLGPALSAAFDDSGAPTKAAAGFARSCGLDVDALDSMARVEKDGVTKLAFISEQSGQETIALLPDMVAGALAALPIAKVMRWGAAAHEFVRPVRWLLMLFGRETVPATVLGVISGDVTYGHRVHHNGAIKINEPADYAARLESKGRVIADFSARRARIREQVLKEARRLKAQVDIDEYLLDEVTALVEWPVALSGSFDEAFLALPPEVLVLTMKTHQKCFCLRDKGGALLPSFITVSNLESTKPEVVVAGNERVIRPRLDDARFFYDSDRRQPLESRRERLKQIVFQEKLGSVYDKSLRVEELAGYIAGQFGVDAEPCRRAAALAKCDLLTGMVAEFPDLQGVMGGYYYAEATAGIYAADAGAAAGRASVEPQKTKEKAKEIAVAIAEQYMPRFAGDALPVTDVGAVLALAEKIDTITGLFAIGQPPTGSKDPFALRRAAIGVLRILVEKRYDLDVYGAITEAAAGYKTVAADTADVTARVFDFLQERFRAWYQDEGVAVEVFLAVQAVRPRRPLDFDRRVRAVQAFLQLPEAASLAAANKRVAGLLGKQDEPLPNEVDETLLKDEAEAALFEELSRLKELHPAAAKTTDDANDAERYETALSQLAALRGSVDRFFDEVLVMCEDDALRRNRLALLRELRGLFLQVADISHLHRA